MGNAGAFCLGLRKGRIVHGLRAGSCAGWRAWRFCAAGEVVAGQQVEGPVQDGENSRTAYPEAKENFACLYSFVDAHYAIMMDEGGSPSQVQSMAVFGLMLPDR